ncbi:TPA: type 8 capsular polysaccharide synthesis protein Cap8J, partial [Staphylococcus aureus]|nr:type 8 capsular polysaccharide synthesis protein Cap8J [Staphylococcus aureus]
TANHNIKNLKSHAPGEDVKIGNYSWIGMNSVILPGVELGEHTIVGAGSVVTKSFPEGNVVIGGNPAKVIKKI